MKRLAIAVLEKIIRIHLRDIPISAIRLEKTRVSMKEGWGGQTIESFPPCRFFRIFVEGNKGRAIKDMEQWYYKRFVEEQQYSMSKTEGGMQGGSLYRLVTELHRAKGIKLKDDLSNADDALIRQGIKLRTLDRFSLLDSIRTNGYQCNWDYIRVKKEDDFYTLKQGNHRVAAFAVCGHSSVMAATSRPLPLRIATRIVGLLLKKDKDYHSWMTKSIFSATLDGPQRFNSEVRK